jgi:hypothetical protein
MWVGAVVLVLAILGVCTAALVYTCAAVWLALAAADTFLHARVLRAVHGVKTMPPTKPDNPRPRPASQEALDALLRRELLPLLVRLAHEHGVVTTAVCGVEETRLSVAISSMHPDDAREALEGALASFVAGDAKEL